MNKYFLTLTISILSYSLYAQNTYEKGYFINNIGVKTDCLIRNLDWEKNPTEFKYKISENAISKTADIESVKEFCILDISKFTRFKVHIDRSSNDTEELSQLRDPVFEEEIIFLKILIEGKVNLYIYTDSNLTRYFYKFDESNVEQLVYKRYLSSKTNYKIRKNVRYKQQLWNNVKCNTIEKKEINKIKYSKKELVKYFIKYNECNNSEFINFTRKKRDFINLTIRPGINQSSLIFDNYSDIRYGVDMGNQTSFRIGIEAEIIMPFNNNKWAFIIEPSYQYFKAEKTRLLYFEYPTEVKELTAKVDYKSIDIPVGIRYYQFVSDKSKFFVNASLLLSIANNSTIVFEHDNNLFNGSDLLKIKFRENLVFGLGYNYNNKLSLELRYGLKGDFMNNYIKWWSEYQQSSVILGYTLF